MLYLVYGVESVVELWRTTVPFNTEYFMMELFGVEMSAEWFSMFVMALKCRYWNYMEFPMFGITFQIRLLVVLL